MVSPPIALASLSIRDFRGIDTLELDFRGPDGLPNQLVVLAGPNGSGKTAVLEAGLLVVGSDKLLGGAKGRRAVRRGAKDYTIEAMLYHEYEESNQLKLITRSLSPPEDEDLVPEWYFPASRATTLVGPMDATVQVGGRGRSKSRVDRLKSVKQDLVNAATKAHFPSGQKARVNQYGVWIESINRAWKLFYPGTDASFEVDVVQDADQLTGGTFDLFLAIEGKPRLEVDFLSAGQLELFIFIASLTVNMQREGIVFIDEPELHLDPQWHPPLMRSLIELQPKAQFIVATHSPEIYDSARSYERHFLVPESDPRARLWQTQGAER